MYSVIWSDIYSVSAATIVVPVVSSFVFIVAILFAFHCKEEDEERKNNSNLNSEIRNNTQTDNR